MSVNEHDLLSRAVESGGAMAASERAPFLALLRKILLQAEVVQVPSPPLMVPRDTKKSTA